MVVVWRLGGLVDEVGVSFQITDQGMALGEGKAALESVFADQSPDVFEAVGATSERLVAGRVERGARMLFDQAAQRHDRAQRLGSSRINGCLRPLAAWISQYRRPVALGRRAPGAAHQGIVADQADTADDTDAVVLQISLKTLP